jgi:hypothetical protein
VWLARGFGEGRTDDDIGGVGFGDGGGRKRGVYRSGLGHHVHAQPESVAGGHAEVSDLQKRTRRNASVAANTVPTAFGRFASVGNSFQRTRMAFTSRCISYRP